MAVLTIEACSARRAPGRLMRRIDKLMSAYVEKRFESLDVSFTQWIALKVVRDGVARNAGELARELDITTGATTRMIDALEARGLMRRDRGHADRRVVQLALSAEGAAAVASLQKTVVCTWNEALVDFEQDEVEALIVGLEKLLVAAERLTGGANGLEEAE